MSALWRLKDSFLAVQKDAREKQGRERKKERETGRKERGARVPRHYDGEYSASVMYGAIGRSTQDAGRGGMTEGGCVPPRSTK